MNEKILIIGPFGNNGGRELEGSFIAKTLSQFYNVELFTTGNYYEKSEVTSFCKNISFNGVNKLLYDSNLLINILIKVLSFFKRNNLPNHFRTGNKYLKKHFKIEKLKKSILEEKIKENNIIFICAQLSSSYMKDIINIAKFYNKKILFRTTGTIKERTFEDFEFLKKVDIFIHHSLNNVNNFEKFYYKHTYKIIDQCSFIEKKLLRNSPKKGRIKKFLVLSRLSEEKGIENVIESFNCCTNKELLLICGDGVLEKKLKLKAKNNPRIIFKGFVSQDELPDVFKEIDCLIISSTEEAGPITGIEAMASGALIISTRVGAMKERLDKDCFWYDGSLKDLEKKIIETKNLDIIKVNELSISIKNRYLNYNSKDIISGKYLDILDEAVKY
ncbi:glycosyltransferase [Flavicella sp.]|uniref:glycosyltransferase n=1 Tax=Flavicella sp. TaxID=2957742 RepID=UPI0030196253